jgi:DHA1 family bicyclomycin/chloramphenicol resistance-like MFS transporter
MQGLTPAPPSPDPRDLGRRLIVASAAIGALGPFAMHVLLPALPSIAAAFAVRASAAQLLVSLALLAIALGNLVVAPLSDRYGRRPVIFAGLWLFVGGSVAAVIAPSLPMLVAARIVQAFGAGAAMAVARAAISDHFGPERSAGALATTATAVLVVPMVAPTLGGFTVEAFDWRAAFAMAVAFGVAALWFTWRRTAETHAASPAAGPSPRTLTSYRRLLGNPGYLAYVGFGGCMMGTVTVFVTSAPYVAIQVLGIPPSAYGLLFILPAAASFGGFFFTARMARRIGGMRMMRMGAALSCAGAAALLAATLAGANHPLALFVPGMVICCANALSAPNSTSGAIGSARDVAGAASGLLGFFQLLVGAAATQAVATLASSSGLPLAATVAILNLLALGLLVRIGRRGTLETVARPGEADADAGL